MSVAIGMAVASIVVAPNLGVAQSEQTQQLTTISYNAAAGDLSSQGFTQSTSGQAAVHYELDEYSGSLVTRLDGRFGRSYGVRSFSSEEISILQDEGFHLNMNLRVIEGQGNTVFLNDDSRRYLVWLQLTAQGALEAIVEGGGTYTLAESATANDFHQFEIRKDSSKGLAQFIFNGQLIDTWNGIGYSGASLYFGNGTGNTAGQIAISSAELTLGATELVPAYNSGEEVVYLPENDRHFDQSFEFIHNNDASTSLVEEGGKTIRLIDGVDGLATYDLELNEAQYTKALNDGYRIDIRASVEGDYNNFWLSDGEYRYLPWLLIDANGNLAVRLESNEEYVLTTSDPYGFYDYQLRVDGATKVAELLFEGRLIASFSGKNSGSHVCTFGNGSANG